MSRIAAKSFAACVVVGWCVCGAVAFGVELIPQTRAEQWNMRRAWFYQVEMDRDGARVQNAVVYGGRVYVLTNRGTVQAIDLAAGRSLWTRMVGNPNHPSLGPGVNSMLAAVINGSTLYLIDAGTGSVVKEERLPGAPGASPALSDRHAFVPLTNGKIYAFSFVKQKIESSSADETAPRETEPASADRTSSEPAPARIQLSHEYQPPLSVQGTGRSLWPPIVVPFSADWTYCVWVSQAASDREGYLNISVLERQVKDSFYVRNRMTAPLGFAAAPAYVLPDPKTAGDRGLVVAAGLDGFVSGITVEGKLNWKFSTGGSVLTPPVVIDDRVFVCTANDGMFCLDARTGRELWWAAGVVQFLASGKSYVYVADQSRRLVALDAQTGQRHATLLYGDFTYSPANDRNDRLVLISRSGLVQCLHETQLAEPLNYNVPAAPGSRPAAQQQGLDAGGEQPAADRPTTRRAEAGDNAPAGNRPQRPQEPADPFQ